MQGSVSLSVKRGICKAYFDEVVGQNGLERRLLATVQWTVATAVALPQQSESIVINRRLTEVPMKIEASLSLLEIQPCTLKTEHCDYDAIMRRQQ